MTAAVLPLGAHICHFRRPIAVRTEQLCLLLVLVSAVSSTLKELSVGHGGWLYMLRYSIWTTNNILTHSGARRGPDSLCFCGGRQDVWNTKVVLSGARYIYPIKWPMAHFLPEG